MTDSKHTPGPWRICAGNASSVSKPGIVKPIKCGSQADARLIAAAPDLLDALRKIRAEDSCSPIIAYLCDAAIAKAEGK